MKKLLLTVLASSVLAANANVYTESHYDSAAEVRDALSDIYESLDVTTDNSGLRFTATADGTGTGAADEYAELLYMIDERDNVDPISLSFDDDGLLDDAEGGEDDEGFTIEEIIAQIEVFETQLETELFGDWDHTTADGVAASNATITADGAEIGTGIATNYLEHIIDELNAANEIITDTTSTFQEKKDARDSFFEFYHGTKNDDGTYAGGGAKDNFNNAVSALVHITASLGSVTASDTTGMSNFILGNTADVTSFSDTAAIIPHESGATNKYYASYVAYVNGTITWATADAQVGAFTFGYEDAFTNYLHPFNLEANTLSGTVVDAATGQANISTINNNGFKGIELTYTEADGNTYTYGIRAKSGGLSATGVAAWAIHPSVASSVLNSAHVRTIETAGQEGLNEALAYIEDYHEYVVVNGNVDGIAYGDAIPTS